MREAAIDSRGASPRSRSRKVRKRGVFAGLAAPALRLMRAHPAKTALGAILILGMGFIVGNATLFQKGRHPAPLFGAPPHPSSAQATAAAVPIPRSRPLEPTASIPSVPPAASSQSEASGLASQQASREDGIGQLLDQGGKLRPAVTRGAQAISLKPPARREDGIAKLLENGSRPQPASQASGSTDANILGAQRALQKLGYDIKPDGHLGAATRQALEKFQRDRHLPVDGALSPKILHQLGVAQPPPRG